MEDFVGQEQDKVLVVDLIRHLAVFGHIIDDRCPRFPVWRG